MTINSLIDLIENLFYGNYDNVMIIDTSERTQKIASEMTMKQLKSYDITKIDGIQIGRDSGKLIVVKF